LQEELSNTRDMKEADWVTITKGFVELMANYQNRVHIKMKVNIYYCFPAEIVIKVVGDFSILRWLSLNQRFHLLY